MGSILSSKYLLNTATQIDDKLTPVTSILGDNIGNASECYLLRLCSQKYTYDYYSKQYLESPQVQIIYYYDTLQRLIWDFFNTLPPDNILHLYEYNKHIRDGYTAHNLKIYRTQIGKALKFSEASTTSERSLVDIAPFIPNTLRLDLDNYLNEEIRDTIFLYLIDGHSITTLLSTIQ